MIMSISFISNGCKVSAILSTPKTTHKSIVVMVHGLNSRKDSSTNIALEKILLEHNIASFRFDLFAHGESDGLVEERSVAKFVENILDALAYVKRLGYHNIALCGASFGGVAAAIASSKNQDITVLILKSPGMGKTSREMSNYKDDFEELSWIKAGNNISIPALIVHGAAGKNVEVDLGKKLAAAIKQSKVVLIDGADHSFTRKEDFEKMIHVISQFIIEQLGRR